MAAVLDSRPTRFDLAFPADRTTVRSFTVSGVDLTGASVDVTAPLTAEIDGAAIILTLDAADAAAGTHAWQLDVSLPGDVQTPWIAGRLTISTAPGEITAATTIVIAAGDQTAVTIDLTPEPIVAAAIAEHVATPDPHGDRAAAANALAAHEADTTAIHGITDTAALATKAYADAAVATEASARAAAVTAEASARAAGDSAQAIALVAHEADTTAIHGITDTAALVADTRTAFSDANVAPAATARYVAQTGVMNATHTVTLPAANSVAAGREIVIADESGTVKPENRLVVGPTGSDTINGAGWADAITTAYGMRRYRSDGTSRWTVIADDIITGTVEPVRDALAAAVAGAACNILYVGDSISEGQGSVSDSQLSGRWIERVTREFRRVAQPAGVRGGRGYVPAYYDVNSTDYPAATIGFARAGTITLDTVRGLGRRAAQLSPGATLTITQLCTAFDVVYRKDESPNAGVFNVATDGGTPMVVDTTASPAISGGYTARVTPSQRGSHSIVITGVSGAPIVEGVIFYDGDTTIGIRAFDGAKSGYTANSFASNATWFQSMQAGPPAIVFLGFGTNDFRTGRTAAQFRGNVETLISNLRAQCYPYPAATTPIAASVPIVLVHLQDPADADYSPRKWSDYRDVLASIASTTSNVGLIDVSRAAWKDHMMATDHIHPSDGGHARIAAVIAGAILRDWHHTPPAATVVPTPAAVTSGKSGWTQVVGSGSMTATTYGLGVALWQCEDFANPVAISGLVCENTAAGSSGSVVRLVAALDDGSGLRPGTILGQVTIDGTAAAGIKTGALAITLPRGRVWFAAIMQGSSGAVPTMRAIVNGQRSPTPTPLLLNLTAQYPCTGSITGVATDNPPIDGYASSSAPAIGYVFA